MGTCRADLLAPEREFTDDIPKSDEKTEVEWVLVLILDEPFKGHGYSFVKTLGTFSERRLRDIPLPSGVHWDLAGRIIHSCVVITTQGILMGLPDRDREAFLEYFTNVRREGRIAEQAGSTRRWLGGLRYMDIPHD